MDMSNLSLYEDTLKFYFVQSDGHDQWDRIHPMVYSREKLREKVTKENIFDVTPDSIMANTEEFTKKHIVIFNDFKGDVFDHVRGTRALILGPRSVISALMDNIALPTQIQSPMFNLAMRDLIVCLSSFDTQEKLKYRKLINYMGGICIDQLTEAVTHLVTDSVRSKKYEQAILRNMKVMKSSWVHAVWDANLKDNIPATNPQFDHHIVPTFFNLAVTTTGLSRKDKKLVEQLVESNGGTYRGEFSGSSINIVVAKKDSEETPKIKAALTANKECLSVNWIVDSARKGFALPLEDYRIDLQRQKMTSTPEKGSTSGYGFEASQTLDDLSAIPFSGVHNETVSSNLSRISDCSIFNRRSTESIPDVDSTYKITFEKMNLADAKKAGLFLDGCNVFICGFSNEEKEKVVKIMNVGGATRYDTINSNLSHILIGNPSKKDIAMLQAVRHDAILVKLQWLADSITAKTAIADCQKYIYRLNGKQNDIDDDGATAPSPASKRNILSMSGMLSKNANPKRLNFDGNMPTNETPNKPTAADNNLENLILDQYMNPNDIPAPLPIASTNSDQFKVPKSVNQPAIPQTSTDSVSNICSEESTMATQDDLAVRYLDKLKIYIHGFSDDSTETLIADCEQAGAEVYLNQNYHGTVDYLIVPMDVMTLENIAIKAKYIVNQNWLVNAKRSNKVSEIPYFYEPIYFDEDLKPLAGLIIAISIYASDERLYLVQLAEILGAEVQETYIRVNKPLLICPEPKSPKYEAAIRWNLSVVNRHWLMDCHKYRKRLPLKNYLVGDSIAPINDVSEDDDEVLNSQHADEHEQVNLRRKDNLAKLNGENVACNRRVDELRGTNRAKPQAPLPATSSPGTDNEFMNGLDTPTRNSIKQMAKEYDDLTPQSKRRRCDELGIKTPEELTTPYITEQRRQYYEELRMERQKEKKALEKEKESKTPWTEYKRRFWKNVLGDDYESPSQCYAGNTQDVSVINDSIRPTTSGRQLNYDLEPEANTEVDRNIQKLQDFIKNRNPDENDYASNEPLPHTEPPESDMINSEPHEIIGWHDPKDNFAGQGNAANKLKSTPCFSISCPQPDLEEKLTKQINALKGKVCENLLKYDPECTHLLCDKIGSSEKTLSCISSGKWLLTFDYIEMSYKAGRFLDEELFEWGNPKAKNLPTLKSNEAQIANAAYRWRKKVQSSASDSRVFKNFRPILLTTKNDSLRTMVEAGGGTIIRIRDGIPLNKQPDILIDATHVICQPKGTKLTNEEFKALDEANVPAISMTFLKAVITEENTPDIDKYLFK